MALPWAEGQKSKQGNIQTVHITWEGERRHIAVALWQFGGPVVTGQMIQPFHPFKKPSRRHSPQPQCLQLDFSISGFHDFFSLPFSP